MENLAGNKDCDRKIRWELEKADITIVELPEPLTTEVPASILGELPGFAFKRAWYYWVVTGDVPLEVARVLYENPNGRFDVRVDGDCTAPAPDGYAEHFDAEGKRLLPMKQLEENRRFAESGSELMQKVAREVAETSRFVEDPAKEATRSVITNYHIDTQEGLNFFVQTLRAHGVIPEPTSSAYPLH